MRRWWLAIVLLGGCGSTPATPAPTELDLTAELAAPVQLPTGISIAAANLHLSGIHAVSDRSSADPRTRVATLDLAMAGSASANLTAVPPALYSGLSFTLGDSMVPGIDLMGSYKTSRLHATISNAAVYVSCPDPLALAPGTHIGLRLEGDVSHWLDGVDLGTIATDNDDNGIVISQDDNAVMAARIQANVAGSFSLNCLPM
jgi:hypothetical protein